MVGRPSLSPSRETGLNTVILTVDSSAAYLIFGEYAGISTADLNTESVATRQSIIPTATIPSMRGGGMFTYTKVEKDGDLISLYDESYGRKLLTLRQMSDRAY